MKNFKEFSAEWELADTFKDWKIGDCMFALYSAYQQGYNEGMKENLNNMLSAPITMPNVPAPHFPHDKITYDTQAQLLHEEAEKMKVYPEQLKKEYSLEELKEIQNAMARNLSEEEKKVVFARQVEELKQNPNSVLNAIAMQKAAEKVEEK